MKLTKIFVGMAAAAIATSAMAMTAFAADAGKGPNNDDGVSVFGVYIGMTKDEAIANSVLQEDGKEPDDWTTVPVKVTIDEIKFDDNVVTANGTGMMYWQGDELKFELVNVYNDDVNGGKDGATTVFTTLPSKTIEVTFTIDGLSSDLSGKAYVGGGFQTAGADWSSTFFGNKPDGVNPAGTTFEMPDVTGNGTYTAKVFFPDQGGDNTSSGTDSKADSTADSKKDSKTDSKTDSKANSTAATTSSKAGTTGTTTATSSSAASDNTAATGATAGIALAGIALAGAAIVVSKRK